MEEEGILSYDSRRGSPTESVVATQGEGAVVDTKDTSTNSNSNVNTSGTTCSHNATAKKSSNKYRTGKWTEEETKYASQIIRCFGVGVLKLPPHKSLRSYLSGELDCDPMRVTKKFPGTALLMKEVSDESKPEPNQSVIHQALLKLKALEDAFRERLRKDQSKQGSRPSVFSLMDEEIATHNTTTATATTSLHTAYPAPASADIVQPKMTTTMMHPMGNHHHLHQHLATPIVAAQHSTLRVQPQQQQPSLQQQLQVPTIQQQPHQPNPTALSVPVDTRTTPMSFATGDKQQPYATLLAAPTPVTLPQVSSENMGLLLSSATAGSPLAAALSTPYVLAHLWKLQEQQEEQVKKQRATLEQLSPPGLRFGLQALAGGVRSVTPPMNHSSGVPQPSTTTQQHPVAATPVMAATTTSHNTTNLLPPSLYHPATFPTLAATLPHSQSAPHLASMFLTAPVPSGNGGALMGAPTAPQHQALNPQHLQQMVNAVAVAATPTMPQQRTMAMAPNLMTAATGAMQQPPATASFQQQQQHLPHWLALMAANGRK